jgi:hypothetical protein
MANVLYDKGREGFLDGSIDWDTDDIRVILVDGADYTFSAAHDFLDDVAAGGRVAVSSAFSSKTVTSGIADSADVTLSAVTGDPCEMLVIYKHTGSDATSRLIAKIDTVQGGGALSVTPNGGDITIQWDNSTNKIFKL